MAAMKRRQVADIDAGAFDLVYGVGRDVAALAAYQGMRPNSHNAVSIS